MIIASIDFETANRRHTSICAASVAVFEAGELVESPYWLVKPPKGHGYFLPEFTENCHGLNWFDVQRASEFSVIAPELVERLTRADLVIAHNASFDMLKLWSTLQHFGLACPGFNYLCTLQLARRLLPGLPDYRLSTLAAHIGHTFQHHHAQADAEAAGRVMLAMMGQAKVTTTRELMELPGIPLRRFSEKRYAE